VGKLNKRPDLAVTVGTRATSGLQPIELMVEREGLEPAGSLSQLSNLLMNLDFLSPQFPSDPRFWHSIWHRNPLLVGSPVAIEPRSPRQSREGGRLRWDEVGSSIAKAQILQVMFKNPQEKRIYRHDSMLELCS